MKTLNWSADDLKAPNAWVMGMMVNEIAEDLTVVEQRYLGYTLVSRGTQVLLMISEALPNHQIPTQSDRGTKAALQTGHARVAPTPFTTHFPKHSSQKTCPHPSTFNTSPSMLS